MGNTRGDKTTEELLKNVSKGDTQTITALLKELDGKLRYSFLKQGLELRDIEEVMLDSISILIQKVRKGEYEDRGIPIIVYLIKIARIRSYQYLRKSKLDVVPLTKEILSTCNGELQSLQDWDAVKDAIKKLPSNQKKLVELTFFNNFSDSRILEENLTPYSSIESIRSQRHKALKKLCKFLSTKS